VRQTRRRTAVNRMRRTRLRHGLREIRRRIEAKDATGAAELVPGAFSIVDRAARWGIIKKNTAARYKSRITARLRALTPASA